MARCMCICAARKINKTSGPKKRPEKAQTPHEKSNTKDAMPKGMLPREALT